jgi:imidazolonepropionase
LITLHGPNGPRRGADLRNLAIIQDGSVLIADGLIREVGPTRRIENLAESRQAEEINAAGRVVLPGFVDSHTHLVSGPSRLTDYEMHLAGASPAQIAEAGGGLPAISKSIQDVAVRTLEHQAWRVLRECIRQGTTTIEAKSGYGFTESGEIKILRTHSYLNERLRNVVSTFMGARFVPAGYTEGLDAYVRWLCSHMLPLVHRRKYAEFVDVFCEEGMFTIEQARRILTRARELGFALKIHGSQHWNIGAIKLAVELGAVSVDHAIFADREDIELLAQSGTIATLLPGPVFYTGMQRYAHARNMIDRGVAVALATNFNPATCPGHNMQMIIALACRKMQMTPAEAISAATINGAYAINRGDKLGSIEFGKLADLLILRVSDYREIPYHFGVNLVNMTMKAGEVIYQASEVKCPEA